MKKAKIKKVFIEMLDEKLLNEGFMKIKTNEWIEYEKQREWGFNKITPIINQYSSLFFISLGFGLRINEISQITSLYLDINPDFLKEATTLNFGFNSLNYFEDSRIKVENEDNLKFAIKMLADVIDNEALAFFEKYRTASDIDRDVNKIDLPSNSIFYGVRIQPFIGLTSSVLCKSTESKFWEDFYRRRLIDANQHIRNQYEKLVLHLKENFTRRLFIQM